MFLYTKFVININKIALNPYQIKNKTILCSALTWGMGHTTRMAALLKILSENQNKIILLGNRKQILYYEQLNLGNERIICKSPDIRYYRGIPLWLSVVIQIPFLIRMSINDCKLVRFYVRKFNVDLVISDNRYGFYSNVVPSFLVTHQVWPLFPFFRRGLHRWFEKKIYSKFTEIWVPDVEVESNRLSGCLSDARSLPNIRYIGWLSVYRFVSLENIQKEKYDECWLLNGPANEQKRYYGELLKTRLTSAENLRKRIVVCGTVPLKIRHKNLTFYFSPSPYVIKMLLLESEKIFSRIGYTTLMDAAALNIMHKMHFSPTPGQTEQEYLFKRFTERTVFNR